MTKKATTPEFELLVSAANFIRPEFEKDKSPWAGSQLEWVLSLPSASKGKLGKRLVNQWCAVQGLSIHSSPDSQADMMINGHRVEIKFSTLWETNVYKFQQIRDQNYEYAVCLGISPFEAHCWVISKKILKQYVIGHMGQHTGSSGQETAWFAVNPQLPPNWILPCWRTLEQAYKVLKSLSNKK